MRPTEPGTSFPQCQGVAEERVGRFPGENHEPGAELLDQGRERTGPRALRACSVQGRGIFIPCLMDRCTALLLPDDFPPVPSHSNLRLVLTARMSQKLLKSL